MNNLPQIFQSKSFAIAVSFLMFNVHVFSQKLPVHPFFRHSNSTCCDLGMRHNHQNLNKQKSNYEYQSLLSESLTLDTIQYAGDSENTYDLVILAEGYTQAEMPKFKTDAKKVKESLLKNDVYSKLLPKMNIFSIGTVSAESGISWRKNSPLPTDPIQAEKIKNTYFGIYFLNSFRAYFLDDSSTYKAKNLASEFIPFSEVVLILANDEDHSSGRARFEGVALATRYKSSDSIWSNYLVNHELAHSIGNLYDEYSTSKRIGFNQDITNDPTKIRWKDMLHLPGVKIDSVVPGAYIPNIDCMMAYGAGHFTCPVCTKRINEVVEEPRKLGNPHRIILEKFDKEKKTITYRWDAVPSATAYEVVLWASWRGEYFVKNTNETKITFELTDADAIALDSWTTFVQIRAYNAKASSKFEYHRTSIYAHTTLSVPVVKESKKISETSYKIYFESKDQAVKVNWFRLYNEDGIHSDILTYKDSITLNNLKKDKKYFYQLAATFPDEARDYFSSPFSQLKPLIEICAQPKSLSGQQFEYCLNGTTKPLDIKADDGNTLLWYSTDTSTTSSLTPPVISSTKAGTSDYYVSQTNALGCESSRTKISVKINNPPSSPMVQNLEFCKNTNARTFNVTPDAGNQLVWYPSLTSTSGNTQAPSISTATIGTFQFFLSQKDQVGCESQKATINVKINDTPSSPRIENIQFCQFTSFPDVNVQFEPGNNLRWYPSDTASVSYPSVPDFSTSTPGTYRYHVSQIDSKGCESPRKTFSITLSPTPSQLKLEDQIICQNTLTPTYKIPLDAGNEAIWYTNITDVSGSNIPPQIQTGNPGFVQYYISQRTSFGCVSLKSSIKIIINPSPTPPIVESKEYCQNTTWPSIDIKPNAGNTLKWYATDTSKVSSTNSPVESINTFNPGLTPYFVSQTSPAGCESNKSKFEVRINPQPSRLVTEESAVCQNAVITKLNVTAEEGNRLLWYTTITGGTGSQTIPNISTSTPGGTRLWVTQVSNKGCESLSAQASISIMPQPATPTLTLLNNLEIRSSAEKNHWFLNNSRLPDTLQTIMPKVSGNYTAIAIEKQCQSQPSLALSFMSTSVLDEEIKNFTIQPNPFSDFLTINYENTGKVISKIDFFSLTGEIVKSLDNLESRNVIDMADLPSGIYFLRVQIETMQKRPFFKLVKY